MSMWFGSARMGRVAQDSVRKMNCLLIAGEGSCSLPWSLWAWPGGEETMASQIKGRLGATHLAELLLS